MTALESQTTRKLRIRILNKSAIVEPNESLGIRFIVGWKEPLLGVVGSTIEG